MSDVNILIIHLSKSEQFLETQAVRPSIIYMLRGYELWTPSLHVYQKDACPRRMSFTLRAPVCRFQECSSDRCCLERLQR